MGDFKPNDNKKPEDPSKQLKSEEASSGMCSLALVKPNNKINPGYPSKQLKYHRSPKKVFNLFSVNDVQKVLDSQFDNSTADVEVQSKQLKSQEASNDSCNLAVVKPNKNPEFPSKQLKYQKSYSKNGYSLVSANDVQEVLDSQFDNSTADVEVPSKQLKSQEASNDTCSLAVVKPNMRPELPSKQLKYQKAYSKNGYNLVSANDIQEVLNSQLDNSTADAEVPSKQLKSQEVSNDSCNLAIVKPNKNPEFPSKQLKYQKSYSKNGYSLVSANDVLEVLNSQLDNSTADAEVPSKQLKSQEALKDMLNIAAVKSNEKPEDPSKQLISQDASKDSSNLAVVKPNKNPELPSKHLKYQKAHSKNGLNLVSVNHIQEVLKIQYDNSTANAVMNVIGAKKRGSIPQVENMIKSGNLRKISKQELVYHIRNSPRRRVTGDNKVTKPKNFGKPKKSRKGSKGSNGSKDVKGTKFSRKKSKRYNDDNETTSCSSGEVTQRSSSIYSASLSSDMDIDPPDMDHMGQQVHNDAPHSLLGMPTSSVIECTSNLVSNKPLFDVHGSHPTVYMATLSDERLPGVMQTATIIPAPEFGESKSYNVSDLIFPNQEHLNRLNLQGIGASEDQQLCTDLRNRTSMLINYAQDLRNQFNTRQAQNERYWNNKNNKNKKSNESSLMSRCETTYQNNSLVANTLLLSSAFITVMTFLYFVFPSQSEPEPTNMGDDIINMFSHFLKRFIP